jgi:aminoglycoside phosphotransferase (APT) family kinase protein
VPEFDPEHVVGPDQARRLIAEQCFPPTSLSLLGEGWDNTVWLVDDRWAFRFPRRSIALPGVARELAVLGELAPRLPLPIPVPRWVGEPSDAFPWPFFGAEAIAGRELPEAELSHDARSALGRPLGRFLRALHDARVSAELPYDPMGRGDMSTRVPRTVEALLALDGRWDPPRELRDALEDARRLPPRDEQVAVVHGDLHARHLLVRGDALAGVIDWGDVCLGDPAIDLAACWYALPPDGRAEFFAAYGRVSEGQLLRARVLAVFMCATLVVHGTHAGLDHVVRDALEGLERVT